jgi:hypothetical protein
MKKLILLTLMLCTSLTFAAELTLLEKYNKLVSQKTYFQNYNFEQMKKVVSELNDYAPSFHLNIVKSLNEKTVLHGKQLTIMHQIVGLYIGIQQRLIQIANDNPSDYIKAYCSLEALKSYLFVYQSFYTNDRFRRYINDEDLTFSLKRFQLHNQIKKLISSENISRVLNLVQGVQTSSDIKNHPALEFTKDSAGLKKLRAEYKKFNKSDLKQDKVSDMTYRVSRTFGNTAGRVRWRKGYLLNNQKIYDEIYKNIQPLDIISEKTYFALTDKFIPGHFGHNAIWLGTKEQLIELGMWDHPVIAPYQKQIEAGKNLIEVDRSGSHLKSLEDFMNVDELAILRINQLDFTRVSIERIYNILLAQVGKIFDFNFDVETTDTLVCSELIYQSFEEVTWPTEPYLGRTTISPDNVASLALYDDSPLDLVYYAAQKSKKDFKYKNLDDLALDLKFKKVDGLYKQVKKVCKNRRCREVLMDLDYKPHDYIPELKL